MKTDTLTTITQILSQTFSPTDLKVQDDSHLHIGHRPPNALGGHYTVYINALCFKNKSLRESHQMIYQALHHLMGNEIHALSIKIIKKPQ